MRCYHLIDWGYIIWDTSSLVVRQLKVIVSFSFFVIWCRRPLFFPLGCFHPTLGHLSRSTFPVREFLVSVLGESEFELESEVRLNPLLQWCLHLGAILHFNGHLFVRELHEEPHQ